MICPKCGSTHVDRDEVDIGVGTQCGPWACFDCGWSEDDRPAVTTPPFGSPDDDPDPEFVNPQPPPNLEDE
jgi:hypothetical protein